MIEILLDGDGNIVQNYYDWMMDDSPVFMMAKILFTGLWVTSLTTFHFFETFLIWVLAYSIREIYIGIRGPPDKSQDFF